jgi:hypothetical protein
MKPEHSDFPPPPTPKLPLGFPAETLTVITSRSKAPANAVPLCKLSDVDDPSLSASAGLADTVCTTSAAVTTLASPASTFRHFMENLPRSPRGLLVVKPLHGARVD